MLLTHLVIEVVAQQLLAPPPMVHFAPLDAVGVCMTAQFQDGRHVQQVGTFHKRPAKPAANFIVPLVTSD